MKRFGIAILIVSILFIVFQPKSYAKNDVGFDFTTERYDDFVTDLNGEWLYYSNELLRPKDLDSQLKLNEGTVVHLPHKLTNTADYGTYMTTIRVPNNFYGKRLKFNIPFQFSAYKLYINDEILVQNGFTNHSFPNQNFQMKPLSPSFVVPDVELKITLQVAGFSSVNGGINKEIQLGSEEAISNKIERWQFMQAFLIGCIFLMGIIALLIYFFRRKQYEFLAFSLFCFASAIWGLFTDAFLYTIFYDKLSWIMATRLTYVLPMIVMAFYVLYVSNTFRRVLSKRMLTAFSLYTILLVLICIIVKNGLYQQMFLMVNIGITPFYIYFIAKTFKKVNWKDKTEIITFIGVLLVFLASVHDMYVLQQTSDGQQYSFIMIGIFIATQSFINSYKFAIQWGHIEKLNTTLLDLTESLDEKVKRRTKQLQESNEKLQSLAFLDGLTGVYNRHYFNKSLENLYKKNQEMNTAMGIIILDVDEFKQYNDYYGHVLGDQLLIKMARIISYSLPPSIEMARYGGEEFAILLDDLSSEQVFSIAETIRNEIEEAQLEHKGRANKLVTISVGAIYSKDKQFDDENEALSFADEQLYISKEAGRNKVNYRNLG